MNIPSGYRRITPDETILVTDRYQNSLNRDDNEPMPESLDHLVGATLRQYFNGGDGPSMWQILRKLEESPWISVKERLPVEADGDRNGKVFVRWNADGSHGCWHVSILLEDKKTEYSWMKIPQLPKPIAPPITILECSTEHEVIFNKDGSPGIGCVTIEASKMDSIIERRKEVMSGG